MCNTCPVCGIKFNQVITNDIIYKEIMYVPDVKQSIDSQLEYIYNNLKCDMCQNDNNDECLLLCDGVNCDIAIHTYCIGLNAVPNGSWYCHKCAASQTMNKKLN